MVLLDLVKMD